MYSQQIKESLLNKDVLENLNGPDFCVVSKASVEIMLERVCNGNKIDFPFSS